MSSPWAIFGKKWPAPVASPMAPFFAAGLVIMYGINSFADALASGEEYKNDPRNPKAAKPAPGGH